jgi:hypothetical protein
MQSVIAVAGRQSRAHFYRTSPSHFDRPANHLQIADAKPVPISIHSPVPTSQFLDVLDLTPNDVL